nr:hypothetical protein [uncultured Sphingomonas sp.]
MRLSKKFWLTLAIGVAVPAIARAEEWTETRTAHFIVYVNDDATAARDFAGKPWS